MQTIKNVLMFLWLLALISFLCAVPACEVAADDKTVSLTATALTFSPGERGFDFTPAVSSVTITNNGVEPLHIHSLEFRVGDNDIQIDTTPHLIFQLTPFLDVLAVRITNVGWGPYHGESFSLFEPNAKTKDGSRTLQRLFDLATVTSALRRVDREETLVFRTGEKAVPFTLNASWKYDIARMLPPQPVLGKPALKETTYTVYKPVFETRIVRDAIYSGAEYFAGTLNTSASHSQRINFLVREYPRVRIDPRSQILARAFLPSYEPDGLFQTWCFTFGDVLAKMLPEQRVKPRFYLTVDLGDHHPKRVFCPARLFVLPGKSETFDIDFVTTQSSRFSVQGSCKYSVGNSPPISLPFQNRLVGKTRALRPLKTDYSDAEQFLGVLRAKDPDIDKRAAVTIHGVFAANGSPRPEMLTRMGQSRARTVEDAFYLLLTSADGKYRELADKKLQEFSGWALRELKDGRQPLLMDSLFPFLCDRQPAQAVAAAVRDRENSLNIGNDYARYTSASLIGLCIIHDQTQPLLASHAKAIQGILKKANPQDVAWETEDVLLAVVSRAPKHAERLEEALRSDYLSTENIPALVWAASQINNAPVDSAIRMPLESKQTRAELAEAFVEALAMYRNDRFRASVVRMCESLLDDESRAVSLRVCLRYFEVFPGGDLRPVLKKLSEYPYSSDIRNSAKKLLE